MTELAIHQIAGLADVSLAGHEDEDIPAAGLIDDQVNHFGSGFDVVQTLAVIFVDQGFGRYVHHLDREHSAGNLDDGRVPEGFGKSGGIDGSAGDEQLQILAAGEQVFEMAEEEINSQGTFMRFIEDDDFVIAQFRVALDLGQEHAVSHELEAGGLGGLIAEPNLATDFATPVDAQLLGNAFRHAKGGNAARLGAANASHAAKTGRPTHLGYLRGFARAGLARDDYHLMFANGRDDLLRAGGDRQLGRKTNVQLGFHETGVNDRTNYERGRYLIAGGFMCGMAEGLRLVLLFRYSFPSMARNLSDVSFQSGAGRIPAIRFVRE